MVPQDGVGLVAQGHVANQSDQGLGRRGNGECNEVEDKQYIYANTHNCTYTHVLLHTHTHTFHKHLVTTTDETRNA